MLEFTYREWENQDSLDPMKLDWFNVFHFFVFVSFVFGISISNISFCLQVKHILCIFLFRFSIGVDLLSVGWRNNGFVVDLLSAPNFLRQVIYFLFWRNNIRNMRRFFFSAILHCFIHHLYSNETISDSCLRCLVFSFCECDWRTILNRTNARGFSVSS